MTRPRTPRRFFLQSRVLRTTTPSSESGRYGAGSVLGVAISTARSKMPSGTSRSAERPATRRRSTRRSRSRHGRTTRPATSRSSGADPRAARVLGEEHRRDGGLLDCRPRRSRSPASAWRRARGGRPSSYQSNAVARSACAFAAGDAAKAADRYAAIGSQPDEAFARIRSTTSRGRLRPTSGRRRLRLSRCSGLMRGFRCLASSI